MARVKRGVTSHKRHKRLLKEAEGRKGTRSRLVKPAREALLHALAYATRDRKQRKRQMRELWIVRINAAARQNGLTYGQFIAGLKKADVADRPQDPRRPRHPRRSRPSGGSPSWRRAPDRTVRRTTITPTEPSTSLTIEGSLIVIRPDARSSVDLADLTRDLEALQADALASVEAAGDVAALDALELDVLGKKGRLTARPARDRRAARRGSAQGRRRRQRGPRGDRGARSPSAARRSAGRSSTARLTAETVDVTTPGRPIRRGSLHPSIEAMREIADDLRAVRVRDLREPRDRGRRHELPDAQHPARPPGAGPVGHALRRRRRAPAPDPHVARPDPGHAVGGAADPGAAARSLLPLRGDRREPRQRVLPGRGPDGRRGHDHGRPQGPPRPVRQGDVRGRQADPLPARLLPVHRAVRGLRRRVPRVRRLGLSGLRPDAAG